MQSTFTCVSALALGLALAAPAGAQQQTDVSEADQAPAAPDAAVREPDATDPGEGQLGIDAPVVITDPTADAIDDEFIADDTAAVEGANQLREILGQIGAEEVGTLVGSFSRTRTEEGRTIAMFIGPDDLAAEDAGAFTFEHYAELQERLGDVFEDLRQVAAWNVKQGRLDRHSVLALSARDPMAIRDEFRGTDAAEGDFDALGGALSEAGVESVEEIDLALFHGEAAGGRQIFLIVGPDGFQADGSLDVEGEDLLERLEEAGLSDARQIEDGARAARGELDGRALLALSASVLFAHDELESEVDRPERDALADENGNEEQ